MKKTYITPMQAMLTAIGCMIGSGIYFRASTIIESTQGNVWIAVFSWLFMGVTLIFAAITFGNIAMRTKQNGGIIGYIEEHYGKKAAFLTGWFEAVIVIPLLGGVAVTIFTDYLLQLFRIEATQFEQYIIWIIVLTVAIGWNILSTRIAAMISSSATVIKVIPLILLAIIGIFYGEVGSISGTASNITESADYVQKSTLSLFFAPMLSMAFAFNGWVKACSLSVDMENPQKDMPKVLLWSMVITTTIYVTYFIGVNALMPDSAALVAEGKGHLAIIANQIFGPVGEMFIIGCVTISVLGTMNGNLMAGSRYFQKLGDDKTIFLSNKFGGFSKWGTPAGGAVGTYVLGLVAITLFHLQKVVDASGEPVYAFLQGIKLDDIPIALHSMLYLTLFLVAFRMYKKKEFTFFQGVVAPLIATIGQVFIIYAFFFETGAFDKAVLYMIISAIIIGIGYVINRKRLV